MFIPHQLCIQYPLFITLVYNYKGQTLLQLYSDYVMHYKPSLKYYYYYFHVYFNKYYHLLKKKLSFCHKLKYLNTYQKNREFFFVFYYTHNIFTLIYTIKKSYRMFNNLAWFWWFQCIQYTRLTGMITCWQKQTCVTVMIGIVQMNIEPKLCQMFKLQQLSVAGHQC